MTHPAPHHGERDDDSGEAVRAKQAQAGRRRRDVIPEADVPS
jgi:hypothetical protein